jgi:hypothetical protein
MSSGHKGLDATSKLGRAIFGLLDATFKMHPEIRARAIRIKNMVDAAPDDQMTRFKISSDLSILMRDARLNAKVRAIEKAMPK